MSRNKTPRKPSTKPAAKPTAKRVEWVQYLPAIITATTALLDLLLKHFKP